MNSQKKIEINWEFLKDIPDVQEYRITCKGMPPVSLPKECGTCAFEAPPPGKHTYQLMALDSSKNIVEMHTAEITVISDQIASQCLHIKNNNAE